MLYKPIIKIICLLIIIGLNWAGLSAVIETIAYYQDSEDSSQNGFSAATLDFSLVNNHIEDFIGMEAESDIEFASLVIKITGSLDVQYEVYAEKISGNDNFCNALLLEAKHNGIEKHNGTLLSLSVPAIPQLGTWEFKIDLPVSASNVPHGVECNVDLVFKGWRTDVVSFEDSGFTDEERINLRLTSRMIVLNEFLPNPDGLAYGFDFGQDKSSMPQGEWVELYNNSDYDFDLAGWYIKDSLDTDTNKIMITAANTYPAGTVINAKSWLVVYMNKAVLNNTGDTVKLFDNTERLVDSYTYTTTSDYCNIEPTPGDKNTTEASGSCAGVPPNKSYARIPDGIGDWVDPIPTPGMANKLNEELVEEPVEELVEEPISDGIEEPVIEEEPTDIEATTTEATTSDELIIESATNATESTTEEQQGGLTEVINDVIDEVDNIIDGIVDGIVGEIMPDESAGETVEVPTDDMIVEDAIVEPAPIEEIVVIEQAPVVELQFTTGQAPATEEQPVIAPSNDSASNGDVPSGDGGGSGDAGASGSADSAAAPADSGSAGESANQ